MTQKRTLFVSTVVIILVCTLAIIIAEQLRLDSWSPRTRLFVAFVVALPVSLAVAFYARRRVVQLPVKIRKGPNIIVYIGLILEFAGLNAPAFGWGKLGVIAVLIGIPIFVWGCTRYSKAKGYSSWWGALGLLSLLGLLVLMMIPDRDEATGKAV